VLDGYARFLSMTNRLCPPGALCGQKTISFTRQRPRVYKNVHRGRQEAILWVSGGGFGGWRGSVAGGVPMAGPRNHYSVETPFAITWRSV
jgi:hypothetical protein